MSFCVYLHPRRSSVRAYILSSTRATKGVVGTLYLKSTQKGSRVSRFQVVRGEKIETRDPKEAIELLRGASSIYMVGTSDHPHTARAMYEVLGAYQLMGMHAEVCRHCLAKDRITPEDGSFVRYGGERICFECAVHELELELAHTLSATRSSPAAKYMRSVLSRVRDLDAVLSQLKVEHVSDKLALVDVLEVVDARSDMRVDELPLHPYLKEVLSREFDRLLPVQVMCIRAGLLDGKNLLVSSQTASGKTLVGEIAGVGNVLAGRGKLLFLVPLVALAHQKYDQLSARYKQLSVSLVVGRTRVWTREDSHTEVRTGVDADVLVGTYEGVDNILRSGGDIGEVGCVVIDEVHMLMDEERGHRLDGLIARLKYAHPDAQMLYLSATVGEPEVLARALEAQFVSYAHRPVPLKRYLILCPTQHKHRAIRRIVRAQWSTTSSKGYRGQTIVFTSSRKRCEYLAGLLSTPDMPVRAYHAGLPAKRRREVQRQFEQGVLTCVITTAALAAGVDFPASCVVFDTLMMGIKELSVGEFNQMLGRAGRPDYHDEGSVYLLVDPARRLGEHTEDELAIHLLEGGIEPLEMEYNDEAALEEVLASCACTSTLSGLERICSHMLTSPRVGWCVRTLSKLGLIQLRGEHIQLTPLGRVAATSFLPPSQLLAMLEHVRSETPPIETVVRTTVLDEAHLAVRGELPDGVFSHMLDGMLTKEVLTRLGSDADRLMRFAREFLSCRCKNSPFCGCPQRLFSKRVLELRAEGLDPSEINDALREEYGVYVYGGDLYTYLTQVVRMLESYEQLA
ncbi:MAG: DUF5814 domain-containing protein, partial [Methermicoccaceae archaeon]